MCDYSLAGVPNRLAIEGEQLVVHRFDTGTIGMASSADFANPAEKRGAHGLARWWSALRSFLSPTLDRVNCAVCIPPGARLLLRDIPKRLQHQLEVHDTEVVTFTQVDADAYRYRDAVRFSNDHELLLQRLHEGQRVVVLRLSPEDPCAVEELERAWRKSAAYLRR
jgi:hypothetical protein